MPHQPKSHGTDVFLWRVWHNIKEEFIVPEDYSPFLSERVGHGVPGPALDVRLPEGTVVNRSFFMNGIHTGLLSNL